MRRLRAAFGLLAAALALTGCAGDDAAPDARLGTGAPASSSLASPTPSPTPAAAEASSAPGEREPFERDGLVVDLPAGWKGTGLAPEEVQQAVAEASRPTIARFLTQRLGPASQRGGVMFLYSIDEQSGEVSFVEVYRYPARLSVQDVVDAVIVPTFSEAGFAPEVSPTAVPAGPGQVVSGSLSPASAPVSLVSKVLVIELDGGIVSLSGSSTSAEVAQVSGSVEEVLASVRAG